MTKDELIKELGKLAIRFSEGWHEGIKIDASDIMLFNQIAEALAQPEQEPEDLTIAYMAGLSRGKDLAPQRKPLTDEEIAHATAPVFMGGEPSLTGIARAIEAAHGIKDEA